MARVAAKRRQIAEVALEPKGAQVLDPGPVWQIAQALFPQQFGTEARMILLLHAFISGGNAQQGRRRQQKFMVLRDEEGPLGEYFDVVEPVPARPVPWPLATPVIFDSNAQPGHIFIVQVQNLL